MGKNPASAKKQSSGGDRSHKQTPVKRRGTKVSKKPVREILFPTEPSTIGYDKIDRAIEAVFAARRK